MTSLCFAAVIIFGIFSLIKLPIDLYPDIDTNTIEEFLCDPSKYSERIISNRKAVNKIKDNVADKQLSEDILRPVKLDRAINLWK